MEGKERDESGSGREGRRWGVGKAETGVYIPSRRVLLLTLLFSTIQIVCPAAPHVGAYRPPCSTRLCAPTRRPARCLRSAFGEVDYGGGILLGSRRAQFAYQWIHSLRGKQPGLVALIPWSLAHLRCRVSSPPKDNRGQTISFALENESKVFRGGFAAGEQALHPRFLL
ncbi:hypothetical protein BDN71DRAFT_979457 [Pleurotus eryngii]|uniref:Uncharacterized protein n=1 Tax=Pleurotus eryngii TaxID=5323 RepID=A0A9P5ZVW5_PLEER|nr:hypothetical protein BDN71DRAFT_979457 [Pleurotus eryngii]